MRLVYRKNGIAVDVGDVVTLSGGDKVEVIYFREPHKPSSSGKVTVKPCGLHSMSMEYFVGVIGAIWIEREDQ